MLWRSVSEQFVPERKVSNVPSLAQCLLGRCVPWTLRPLDNASFGWCMSWRTRPSVYAYSYLGPRVSDRCVVPTLDRMEVFVFLMSLLIIVGGLRIRVVRKSPPFFHEILIAPLALKKWTNLVQKANPFACTWRLKMHIFFLCHNVLAFYSIEISSNIFNLRKEARNFAYKSSTESLPDLKRNVSKQLVRMLDFRKNWK